MTWNIVGDSVMGTSHRSRQIPCQDAFRYKVFGPGNDSLVIAVSDGAGSAAHSEIGSELVCDEFVRQVSTEHLLEPLTEQQAFDIFAATRDVLFTKASQLLVSPRELACTALLVILHPQCATFVQLGDGAIIVPDDDDFRTVFWPEPAEYANGTDFLTDNTFTDRLQFSNSNQPIGDVAVITDGLQRVALDFLLKRPHAAFFRPLFAALKSTSNPDSLLEPLRTNLLDSPRVNERTDDDKTLVLAVERT